MSFWSSLEGMKNASLNAKVLRDVKTQPANRFLDGVMSSDAK